MTSSNGNIFGLLALCEGNPVTRSFDVFFLFEWVITSNTGHWMWLFIYALICVNLWVNGARRRLYNFVLLEPSFQLFMCNMVLFTMCHKPQLCKYIVSENNVRLFTHVILHQPVYIINKPDNLWSDCNFESNYQWNTQWLAYQWYWFTAREAVPLYNAPFGFIWFPSIHHAYE